MEVSNSLNVVLIYLLLFLTDPPFLSFSDAVILLKEGNDHEMDFVLKSDPTLEMQHGSFISKDNGSVCTSRVYLKGSIVIFKRVKRSDAGTYTVSSVNAAGQGRASFQLKVTSK